MGIWVGDTVKYRKKHVVTTFDPAVEAKVVGLDATGRRLRVLMPNGTEETISVEECEK